MKARRLCIDLIGGLPIESEHRKPVTRAKGYQIGKDCVSGRIEMFMLIR